MAAQYTPGKDLFVHHQLFDALAGEFTVPNGPQLHRSTLGHLMMEGFNSGQNVYQRFERLKSLAGHRATFLAREHRADSMPGITSTTLYARKRVEELATMFAIGVVLERDCEGDANPQFGVVLGNTGVMAVSAEGLAPLKDREDNTSTDRERVTGLAQTFLAGAVQPSLAVVEAEAPAYTVLRLVQ